MQFDDKFSNKTLWMATIKNISFFFYECNDWLSCVWPSVTIVSESIAVFSRSFYVLHDSFCHGDDGLMISLNARRVWLTLCCTQLALNPGSRLFVWWKQDVIHILLMSRMKIQHKKCLFKLQTSQLCIIAAIEISTRKLWIWIIIKW